MAQIAGKKVLLINPKFTEEVPIFNIPISLVYLGTWLKSRGCEVEILDGLHWHTMEHFAACLSGIDLVGITVMSTQVPNAMGWKRNLKEYLNLETPTVWGGIHPTLYPEQTINSWKMDYVVKGEGEYPLLDILEGKAVGTILDGKEVDINEYPKLDWEIVKQVCEGKSLREVSSLTEFGLPLLTSRGCPWKCTFCINSILDIKYRRRRVDLVLEDIKDALEQGIERIQFSDEDFFADKQRVFEICEGIRKNHLRFKWMAAARVSYFTDNYLGSKEILKELKEGGLYFIGTGAESGSQRILDKIAKGIKPEDTLRMAKCLSEAKIDANFSFMIGLPEETIEDYRKTLGLIDSIIKIDKRFYTLGPQIYRPYPGSKLFEECVKYGLKIPQTLEGWSDSPYIHSEFASKPQFIKTYYPWIDYKGDLSTIVFYATLMGLRPRFMLVTNILRLIGRIRCKLFFFKFPMLKYLYGALRGSPIEKILRRLKII